ncbi:IS630 family transposase, partial [Haloarcula sp. JP-Z28]|nr:IS630 family transposase [Haloarcula sp. JP-Z28]NHN65499.1 IS630 family transposase [Haloarcula sp. JP-Z28]
VGDEDEFHELVKDVFEQVTQQVSYAKKWCEKFLNFQKLS